MTPQSGLAISRAHLTGAARPFPTANPPPTLIAGVPCNPRALTPRRAASARPTEPRYHGGTSSYSEACDKSDTHFESAGPRVPGMVPRDVEIDEAVARDGAAAPG